jgi:hypothetical protein
MTSQKQLINALYLFCSKNEFNLSKINKVIVEIEASSNKHFYDCFEVMDLVFLFDEIDDEAKSSFS